MKLHLDKHALRALAGIGAVGLAGTMITGVPFAAGAAAPAAVAASIHQARLEFGRPIVVDGRTPDGQSGHPVSLEYRPAGGSWTTLATARSGAHGSYRLSAPLRRSGSVRVTEPDGSTARVAGAPAPAVATTPSSTEQAVAVTALLSASRGADVLAGHRAVIAGEVRPWLAGRRVALQVRRHGRWQTVAKASTGPRGRYWLRYSPRGIGSEALRVRFGGDSLNAATARSAGSLDSYRAVQASWYDVGGGSVACAGLGGVRMGVANKTLPCGTRVTLRYGGRRVVATVIDRGPFVAGREYDLTAPVKQALGFPDLGTVWSTR